jgi:hypothetical protein
MDTFVAFSHIYDDLACAPSDERIPGNLGKLLPFFVCDDATVLYEVEVKPWHRFALERWPLMQIKTVKVG